VLSPEATFRVTGPSGRRYEPIAQIGRGGMAEVLLTMVHAGGGIRRLEVLKRIWSELVTEPDFVSMFLDEARLSLRLNHANVVQTYEVLAGEGQLAIAMEYLDGQPLNRVLNRLLRGRSELSLPLRLRILTRVLAGLEYAHTLTDLDGSRLEVVHRDVSPQNVFVTYDGQVKLVDFGVAKTLAASHHTRPGTIKGKLAYMAPEQLQQPTVDRRADLFSVGVMLWEMVAGRRMWPGKTEVEIVGYLASGRPLPPLPLDSSLPTGLDAICERALDPDPDRRYQTAADMEMELEAVLAGSADSHARNLGKVVSLAFAAERVERQALIERSVRRTRQQVAAPSLSSVEPNELPAIDIPVADFEDVTSVRQLAPVDVMPRTPRLRRAIAVGGLAAAVATLVLVAEFGRAPAQAGAAHGAVAARPTPPVAADGASVATATPHDHAGAEQGLRFTTIQGAAKSR
jgi:eukaryotic-like serine/threonine-protein kinase